MRNSLACMLIVAVSGLSSAAAAAPVVLSDGAPGRLVFVSKETEKGTSIWRLNVVESGSNVPAVIAQSRGPILSPEWSPDGNQLAYVGFENGKSSVFIQDLQTGKVRALLKDLRGGGSPKWSPDGATIALAYGVDRNVDIYLVTLSTGELRRVTETPSIDTEPAWSPDGRKIAFTSDRLGSPLTFEVELDDVTTVRSLAVGLKQTFGPSYSPDGSALVMIVKDEAGLCVELLDLQSGKRTRIGAGPLDESPSFSPDGKFVIYAAQHGALGSIEVVSVDGTVRQTLKSMNSLRDPSWSPVH